MGREESSEERRAKIEERARKRRKHKTANVHNQSNHSGKKKTTDREKYARVRSHYEKKNRDKKKDVVSLILLLVFVMIFLFSAYKLWGIASFYKEGNDEYTQLEEVSIKLPEKVAEEELGYEDYYVDFETLISANADTVGWLRFDQPEIISYPIVQTKDNATYLTKTFQATDNNYGTLFVDMNNSPTFDDANTIIYGHNMKNGTMFGSLDKYQDEAYYLESPYFYIYTPDGKASKYQVCAVEIVPADSDRYTISFASDDEYWDYLNKMLSTDFYDTGAPVDTSSKLVTLSTCTSDDDSRLIVQGVKIEEKDMVKPEE